ncbi:unnamed protein product [Symbiodinium natans]|uniref:RING-type domain-containing protein n=1 Tax=Symbiodinium natans TaxID=878477 RepID=A0A812KRE8_9DINO|nr:unnamed protein product [Symbiodinium natans]
MSGRSRADSPSRTRGAMGEATPPAPVHTDRLCCVCLDELDPSGLRERACVPFPTCAAHHLHLGCLAQFRAQASGPVDLLCPLCRHGQCPACSPTAWSHQHDAWLRDTCAFFFFFSLFSPGPWSRA